jgi:hypothetical protein
MLFSIWLTFFYSCSTLLLFNRGVLFDRYKYRVGHKSLTTLMLCDLQRMVSDICPTLYILSLKVLCCSDL